MFGKVGLIHIVWWGYRGGCRLHTPMERPVAALKADWMIIGSLPSEGPARRPSDSEQRRGGGEIAMGVLI